MELNGIDVAGVALTIVQDWLEQNAPDASVTLRGETDSLVDIVAHALDRLSSVGME